MRNERRRKMQAEMTERSYLQWTLIRALVFGERDWFLICAILFFLSDTRDFLTVSGITCFLLGAFLLGPVFGIFIYLASKFEYFRLKGNNALPTTEEGMKKITWIGNAYCAPVIILLGWLGFDLFYQSVESVIALFRPAAG